jgi:hypothetical protein
VDPARATSASRSTSQESRGILGRFLLVGIEKTEGETPQKHRIAELFATLVLKRASVAGKYSQPIDRSEKPVPWSIEHVYCSRLLLRLINSVMLWINSVMQTQQLHGETFACSINFTKGVSESGLTKSN